MAEFSTNSRRANQPARNHSARSLRYETLEDRRMLAVVTVTTNQDVVDFNDGLTSLREAIFATNLVPGPDEIQFDFGHDGPATILLTEGELAITDSLTIIGSRAELLTIDASGNDPTPDENNGDGSRIFNIDDGNASVRVQVDVSISGVTLTGGDLGGGPIVGQGGAIFSLENLSLLDVTVTDNAANHDGGGVFTKGVTTITDSTFSLNQSTSFSGAGLFARDTTLVVTGSLFHGNSSFRDGGGLFALNTTSTISDSTFSGNTAELLNGGGIWVKGKVLIADTTVSGNSARQGGGIFALQAEPTILGSTISGNASRHNGGGIWANTISETMTVAHSTITGNTADSNSSSRGQGGGLYMQNGIVTLDHSIVTGNHDGENSPDIAGIADSSFSLIGFGAEFLGTLADNGGLTQTHALLPGSPAINAGDLNAIAGANGVPQFDQRGDGFDRILSRIDIGAYEVQELGDLNLLVDTLVDESDGDFSRGDLSLREAIELANANPVPDTIRFDPIFAAIAGPLPATILLTEGELAITDSVAIVGLGAELLTIDASGNDPTPDENLFDGSRIFNINDGADAMIEVSLSGLTLTGGSIHRAAGFNGGAILSTESLSIVNSSIVGNAAGGSGGGIFSAGNLLIDNTIVAQNIALRTGGGIYARLGTSSFANIYVTSVTISNSTVRDNLVSTRGPATGGGGGVYLSNIGGTVLIINTLISGNQLHEGSGAGIHTETLFGGTTSLVDSTIIDNVGLGYTHGAGLSITSGKGEAKTTVRNTIISGNTIPGVGAGVLISHNSKSSIITIDGNVIHGNAAGGNGGGINATGSGSLEIINTTISLNTAANAGGISVGGESIAIRHSTITGNVASNETDAAGGLQTFLPVNLDHTIIAGNRGPVADILQISQEPNDIHNSFIGDNTGSDLTEAPIGSPDADGNLIGGSVHGVIEALLGDLADNGGHTLTHALLPGSPAINAGDPALQQGDPGLPEFDQRGAPFARVAGGRIDIGAYESQAASGILSGDFDDDGDVDGSDFLNWQRNFGSTASPSLAEGDATGDGDVDRNDLAVWEATYGDGLSDLGAPLATTRTSEAIAETVSAEDGPAQFAQAVDLVMAKKLLGEKLWARSLYSPFASSSVYAEPVNAKTVYAKPTTVESPSEPSRPRPWLQPFQQPKSRILDSEPAQISDESLAFEQAIDEFFARAWR